MKKRGAAVLITAVVVVGLALAAGKGKLKLSEQPDRAAAQPGAVPGKVEKLATTQESAQGTGSGVAAMEQAAQNHKYLFAFFWKDEDQQTAAMKKVCEAAWKKTADRAQFVTLKITDPSEHAIVKKFELDRAPMPLALAIAPNGAIMGGFPKKFTEDDLLGAFASPCSERSMKALQDGKLVFLCVQNKHTKSNEEAMQGVRQFRADPQYNPATEVVALDPSDAAEAGFLKTLQVDPQSPVAVTVLLVPPGTPVGKFEGAVTKGQIVAKLASAQSGCCPGGKCGPGGCPPKR